MPRSFVEGSAYAPTMEDRDSRQKDARMTPLQVIGSVLAAAFGVQSNRNRERDFKHGNARAFIVAGLIGTVLFILTVAAVVKLVLP